MNEPKLGWWVQLVDSSAFEESLVRRAVVEEWGTDLVGACICDIDWPETNPMPNSINMYGTADDAPPDFDQMAVQVRTYMEETQYFVFVHMRNVMLSKGGVELVVITKNTVVRVNGQIVIESAVNSALAYENMWTHAADEAAGSDTEAL